MKKIADYGLKEIPFKSQGTHTGKYPYVPSTEFKKLTDEINRVLEGDPRGMLVRGPQGSGKTATREELVKMYSNMQDQIVISQRVRSLFPDGSIYLLQQNLMKQGLITQDFLDKIGYDEHDKRPEKLEEWFEEIIRKILLPGKKCLWIVDEFDLISLAKDATPEEHAMRKPFLHLFSNALEMIADIVKEEKNGNGFCTVLEQTESSAIEFHDYLVEQHTPFAQRISGNNFDLAFDLTETLEVVTKRLEKEREELFSVGAEAEIKEKINNNEYFPLTKETLEWLYNAVVSHYNSVKLNQFRFYEQVLAKSFDIALGNCSEMVTQEIVEEVFREKRDELASTIPTQTGVNLPLQKKKEWEKIISDPNHEIANNYYLDGIVKALKNWASDQFVTVESTGVEAIVQPNQGNEIYMSKIKIDFTFTKAENIPSKTSKGKPKVLTRNFANSIVWYCASKTKNSFTDSDYGYVNTIIEKYKEDDLGTQKTLLTIFDDVTTKNPAELEKIISTDEIFIQHPQTKDDIVGINVVDEKDAVTFRGRYDKEISPIAQSHLGINIRNIGKEISKKEKTLIQISQCMTLAGRDAKRSELIERAIGASEHKKIAPSELNGLGLAGFLNPDTNSAEIPSNLKKLKIMIDKKMTGEQIIEKFGNEHTIKVAKTLGLIKEVEEST